MPTGTAFTFEARADEAIVDNKSPVDLTLNNKSRYADVSALRRQAMQTRRDCDFDEIRVIVVPK